ncbi:metal ABC transporter ATP-binding protein [Desulfogranum japonicum]|uniref:metal ABC transporter ATP-binding protein n=1 Tax=Desulfogranum japonicum TaxID=231447 RepID=UPI000400A1B1|nr:metal ABC transporter ATP-binding protein [Desulfogranum japonicum]
MNTDGRHAIEVEHLTVSYHSKPALLDISVKIEKDLLVGVIGPNGAGKSTFIKAILGFVKPDIGNVLINGKNAQKAKGEVAYVPQRGAVDWDFPITVEEVALMGRYQKIPWYTNPKKRDHDAALEALEMVRMQDFANRQIGELSGGQQQRVFMARALAQGSKILLLDEPFAGVDAATERAILDVLERAKQSGKTLVVVHHDLSTAAEYFDQLILIKQRMFAYGPPHTVLNEELLSQVYEGRLRIFSDLLKKEGEKA